jgi:hypothetical protein
MGKTENHFQLTMNVNIPVGSIKKLRELVSDLSSNAAGLAKSTDYTDRMVSKKISYMQGYIDAMDTTNEDVKK